MKPHLPSCEWTDDDLVIFARLGWVSTWQQRRMIERYVDADRCDADVMLQAQLHPLISGHFTHSGEHVVLRSNLCPLRRVQTHLREQYLNLRRYALRIGGTTLDWPDWPEGDPP